MNPVFPLLLPAPAPPPESRALVPAPPAHEVALDFFFFTLPLLLLYSCCCSLRKRICRPIREPLPIPFPPSPRSPSSSSDEEESPSPVSSPRAAPPSPSAERKEESVAVPLSEAPLLISSAAAFPVLNVSFLPSSSSDEPAFVAPSQRAQKEVRAEPPPARNNYQSALQSFLSTPDLLFPDPEQASEYRIVSQTRALFELIHTNSSLSDEAFYRQLLSRLAGALKEPYVKNDFWSVTCRQALINVAHALFTRIPHSKTRPPSIPQNLLTREFVHGEELHSLSNLSFELPLSQEEKIVFGAFLKGARWRRQTILWPTHSKEEQQALSEFVKPFQDVLLPLHLPFADVPHAQVLFDICNQLKEPGLFKEIKGWQDAVLQQYFSGPLGKNDKSRHTFRFIFYSHLKERLALRNRISYCLYPVFPKSVHIQSHLFDLVRKKLTENPCFSIHERNGYLDEVYVQIKDAFSPPLLAYALRALYKLPFHTVWQGGGWRLVREPKINHSFKSQQSKIGGHAKPRHRN